MALFEREARDPRDALLLAAVTPDITENPTSIDVGEDCCCVINFTQYMTENDIGWADPILNRPNMPVCIRCEPESATRLREGVDQHEYQVADKMASTHMTASKQDELERQGRHGMRMLQMLGDEGEKFYEVSISAVMRAPDHEKLERDLHYYRSVVQGAGIDFTVKQRNQLAGLMAASPLRSEDRYGWESSVFPMPGSTLGYSLFPREPGILDASGITLGHDALGGLVRVNTVDRTATRHNSNIVIFGASGSGKSTTAKKVTLLEYLSYGSRAIIIDPEGEWVELARALGADVISIGAKSSAKLSPLEPRALTFETEGDHGAGDVDEDDDATRQLVLLSTIPFAKSFMELAFDIPKDELDSLEVALEHAYAKYDIDKETTFAEYRDGHMSYPIMKDLYDSLLALMNSDANHRDIYDSLARRLRTAAVGINAPLWNTRSSISTDADFVVINTEDMSSSESMKQAQYYNLLSWVWSEVRMNSIADRPLRIVLDECHQIVNARSLAAADLVKSIVKRCRKRNAQTMLITQDVSDLLSPGIRAQGAAICNNATYKFIGLSEGENARAVADLYTMPDELVERLKKAEKGNFAFFAGVSEGTWLKVDLEPWEKDIIGRGGGR